MNKKIVASICMLTLTVFMSYGQWKGKPVDFSQGKIKVSDNKRFLQHENGAPFFYLGDTAWELFHRLNRENADIYLKDRANKGYTVIQAVALAELNGHNDPNPYGYLPFTDMDTSRPAVKDGPDNDYWDHVDYIVDKANQLGMYIGFLPTWGRYWYDEKEILFNPQKAFQYGKFLGERYKNKEVIWILGGDRNIDNNQHREIMREMAKGLKEGDGGAHLITFHPRGGKGSSEWFHNENWLDFNMRQNGHNADYTYTYSNTFNDYQKQPVKPVIDGEPLYEDHPLSFDAARLGHSTAADVRRPLYWNLFNGAFGHTYGHHSVWQMYEPERKAPVNNPLMPWRKAIQQPGAEQMIWQVVDGVETISHQNTRSRHHRYRQSRHLHTGRRPLPFRCHPR